MTVFKQYNTGTGTWDPIAVGVQGPTGPTGATGPTGPNPGLKLIGSASVSAASYLQIDNCFSSSYTRYKMFITGYGPNLTFAGGQFMTNPSTVYSAGDYYRYGYYVQWNGAGLGAYNAGGETWIQPAIQWTNALDYQGETVIEIMNPYASNTRTSYVVDANDKGAGMAYFINGVCTTNTSFTGFRITPASGTFTGSVTVYGYL